MYLMLVLVRQMSLTIMNLTRSLSSRWVTFFQTRQVDYIITYYADYLLYENTVNAGGVVKNIA